MLELLLPALLTSSVAGLWDLKTTEVPDEIPAVMIFSGIFFWFAVAISTGNAEPLMASLGLGSAVLLAGLVLYRKGQWGAADAWIFASIFYMIPSVGFFASYTINFFLVSVAYMAVYSVVLGFRHRNTLGLFAGDLRRRWKYVAAIPAAFVAVVMALSLSVSDFSFAASPSFLFILALVSFMAVFWRYGVVVEKHMFRKRVSTKDLKPGDVLESSIWVGLTKNEVRKLRAGKKYVTVKEGVRFVPVFPITLAVTAFFGALLPLL
ncbi:MAG: prepilin peptidase [Candidatus Aenigmarchaeota archaeon]|nr:prepilin peptidase [Candidatus Aenigmarchaeota archaeon]